ncbi:MAG: glycosyltransferase family 4 protein, partial [Thermodesulfobacteria bacterium]|nr:glycosyltransferase family 4 protein [Thermodesulfobacteriota bacterium]
MKVAIVRRECGLGFGGAEAYCANVAKGLKEAGHDVVVVGRLSKVREVPWVEARMRGRGSIAKNLSFFFSVKKVIERGGFECVYGLSRIPNADFLRISDPLHKIWLELGYEGRLLPPFIRRFMPRHAALLWQERQAIASARYIITNSNLVKRQLCTAYERPANSVFTLYNGVDLERFTPVSRGEKQALKRALGLKDKELMLLFAGVDFRRKGFEVLLRALSRLKGKGNLKLFAAGFNPSGALKGLVNELGLSDRVVFLGYRKDSEMLYRAADLFCLPTSYDPFANACLEAMACGVPVVTTAQNGAAEL